VTTKVLTMGTFDTLHPGHIYLFEQCRRIAGKSGEVAVTVNTDGFVTSYKGRPPVQDQFARKRMVESVRFVSIVEFLDHQDAKPTIELFEPDFIVIGMDWAPPKDYYGQLMITPSWLEERDIALLYLDRLGDHSSTNLKARIRES
jgi:cytidyltransferase-like protein